MGWSGPAGGTFDLSWTMINKSRMSFSSSMYDRRLESLHVGVSTERVSTEAGAAVLPLRQLTSCPGDDGGDGGERERTSRGEALFVEPRALIGE